MDQPLGMRWCTNLKCGATFGYAHWEFHPSTQALTQRVLINNKVFVDLVADHAHALQTGQDATGAAEKLAEFAGTTLQNVPTGTGDTVSVSSSVG